MNFAWFRVVDDMFEPRLRLKDFNRSVRMAYEQPSVLKKPLEASYLGNQLADPAPGLEVMAVATGHLRACE